MVWYKLSTRSSAPGRLCTRLLPRTEEMGSEELRLLSAITPKGEVFYQGTVQALADRCILFRDDDNVVDLVLRVHGAGAGDDVVAPPPNCWNRPVP